MQTELSSSGSVASAVESMRLDERDHDQPGLILPRPQVQLVVRFGPGTRTGVDAFAMGIRETVRRKVLRAGQRVVTARLQLGAHEGVLGAPAAAFSGEPVPLEALWGTAATRRLFERLDETQDTHEAAAVLESAIAERLAGRKPHRARAGLALEAARRLVDEPVTDVAEGLQVSERHLRRVFHETVGVSPKVFSRLARFRRAVHAARNGNADWAGIAVSAGYYDQAHLIAEFRAISGVTPRALLTELRGAWSLG